jgi:hypothetical protein
LLEMVGDAISIDMVVCIPSGVEADTQDQDAVGCFS